MRKGTLVAAGKADQPARIIFQFGMRNLPFTFARPQFHFCNQAASVLITPPRFHQQRIAPAFFGSDFRANQRANIYFLAAR